MSPTTTTRAVEAHSDTAIPLLQSPPTMRERLAKLVSSVVAAVLGIAPHVLHHVGPLAGAALLAGTGGTLLFGAIGLIASIPFLRRVHRRSGNWRVPGALLVLFAVIFSISSFVVGPAISGGGNDAASPTTTQTVPGAPAETSKDAHGH